MKKIIFAGLTVLLALALITCIDTPNGSKDNDVPFVQSYSADKVVINLDGYGDAEGGRALSLPIAQEGYNFLEVVFQGGATPSIARASWERGKAMSISGVYRGAAVATPINYATTGGVTPSNTVGNAVMFVGRKIGSDITLLAVGKIVDVDGTVGANVTPESKSVTFGLAALKGNTIAATTSFSTPGTNSSINFGTDTTPLNVTAHSLSDTPVAADTTIATPAYTLATNSTNLPIADVLPGIRVVALDTSDPATWKEGFQVIEPVYLMPNGQERRIDGWNAGKFTGTITLPTAGDPLPNPIVMPITVKAGAEGLAAFYFNIPVVAATATTSSSTPPVPAQKWYVRPGIDVAHLDNSTEHSSGGTILILSATSALNDLNITIK